jgi:hypothetical protein
MIADAKRKPHQDEGDGGRRRRQEAALDEALKNTFPASDPVSVEQPTMVGRAPSFLNSASWDDSFILCAICERSTKVAFHQDLGHTILTTQQHTILFARPRMQQHTTANL